MSKPGFQELHPEVKQAIDGIELVGDRISLTDTGNYFSTKNVEGALQELGYTVAGSNSSLNASAQKLGVI